MRRPSKSLPRSGRGINGRSLQKSRAACQKTRGAGWRLFLFRTVFHPKKAGVVGRARDPEADAYRAAGHEHSRPARVADPSLETQTALRSAHVLRLDVEDSRMRRAASHPSARSRRSTVL